MVGVFTVGVRKIKKGCHSERSEEWKIIFNKKFIGK